MKSPRIIPPRLRLTRGTTKEKLEISAPLKSSRKSPILREQKVFEPFPDFPTYFAFQVKEADRLDKIEADKASFFIKKLESLKCERIIDDEIDLDKDNYIIFLGPYSKLFDLFSLIRYMNVFDVNCIRSQIIMKDQKDNILLVLPLGKEENKTYESENGTLSKLFSPRREKELSENESRARKELEEEEYRKKVEELESKHRAFLEEHGLSPVTPRFSKSPRSPISAAKEVLQNLHQRTQKLEKLEDETELLEQNTEEFYKRARALRIQKEQGM